MKRVRRCVFNGLAAISLLLSVATMADWLTMGGYSHYFSVRWWRTDGQNRIFTDLTVGEESGSVIFSTTHLCEDAGTPHILTHIGYGGIAVSHWYELDLMGPGGFRLETIRHLKPDDYDESIWRITREAIMPSWFLALIFALWPAVIAFRWLARRRAKRGAASEHCLKCGYDLRATPDRCPECGTIPAKKI